jgi:integrase
MIPLLEPMLEDFQNGTLARLIQRYIDDMRSPEMKPLGASQLYTLRVIQRLQIGKKRAAGLKRTDVIDMCRDLRKERSPATVLQYVSAMRGALKHAISAWDDCEGISIAPIEDARPFLEKHGIIGKSQPRTRVPTDEEIDALLAYYAKPNERGKARVIRMPSLIAFALASTRRLGEICRITYGDLDWERKDAFGNATPMYMVRDMKHPKKKKGNNKWFPLFPELAAIISMQPRLSPSNPDERIFPFNAKSCSASYTNAKKALGIQGLRFHDNRREAITRWLAKLKNPHKVKLISGHETTAILERVYDATDPATLHAELRGQS